MEMKFSAFIKHFLKILGSTKQYLCSILLKWYISCLCRYITYCWKISDISSYTEKFLLLSVLYLQKILLKSSLVIEV